MWRRRTQQPTRGYDYDDNNNYDNDYDNDDDGNNKEDEDEDEEKDNNNDNDDDDDEDKDYDDDGNEDEDKDNKDDDDNNDDEDEDKDDDDDNNDDDEVVFFLSKFRLISRSRSFAHQLAFVKAAVMLIFFLVLLCVPSWCCAVLLCRQARIVVPAFAVQRCRHCYADCCIYSDPPPRVLSSSSCRHS